MDKEPLLDKRTGCYRVRFCWNRKQHQRSCRTKDEGEAKDRLRMVERTVELLQQGYISIPEGLTPTLEADWIFSGGKLDVAKNGNGHHDPDHDDHKTDRLGDICDAYLSAQAQKQETTLAGERIHVRHLKRVLKATSPLQAVDLYHLKAYKRKRKNECHNGKPTSDATIKKELVTFRQIWTWAKNDGRVKTSCPLLNDSGSWKIQFEKPADREKFKTWAEIERRIKRGGLSDDQVKELWEGLYLDNEQVCELLSHVKAAARYEFIYPMFAVAAYTGARRSEILRSQIDDFDFDSNQVLIRERKRKKDKKYSTRHVPLHPTLRLVMEEWFTIHPGGPYTIQCPKEMPRRKPLTEFSGLTVNQAHRHFEMTLDKSKWSVITGFHVLRHSFGSNLARTGTLSSDVIARWMGHTTEEMKALYQHLFPQDGLGQISVLS